MTWTPPPLHRAQPGDPSKLFGALQTTGYVVSYRPDAARDADDVYSASKDAAMDDGFYDVRTPDVERSVKTVTLGNVTTTTVVDLEPDTRYVFAVAAVVEDRFRDPDFVDAVDLYGRRPLLPGAHVGPRSVFTNATATLAHDVAFDGFDANATVRHGPVRRRERTRILPFNVKIETVGRTKSIQT